MQHHTWIVVADQSRAIIYTIDDGDLVEVRSFDHPEVRKHTSDLMTGSRGRRRDDGPIGGHRSAMDRQTSVQQTEVDHFVQDLTEWLHVSASRNAFDKLVLVASPPMLGSLRPKLSTPVQAKLTATLDKVLTKVPPKELHDRLSGAFPDLLAA